MLLDREQLKFIVEKLGLPTREEVAVIAHKGVCSFIYMRGEERRIILDIDSCLFSQEIMCEGSVSK